MKNKSTNKNLRKANAVKNDEFYTQISDIERELKYYKNQFRGQIVYCNCDDPFESNFFKYFAANFNALGIKKLITTSYNRSPIAGRQLPLIEMEGLKSIKPKNAEAHRIEINKVPDVNRDGSISLEDVKSLLEHDANVSSPLKDNGDFRSKECLELLSKTDIVVTNPPFSLFREYLAQLIENNKKFLIIGNDNARTYKEVFKLIKDNKLWPGYGRVKEFKQADGTIKKFGNVGWLTNLEVSKRHDLLTLYKKFNKSEYSKFDNYDAINVNKTSEIPMDFDGVMGVPITFLDKYNPEQFEIIDGLNRYTILDVAGLNANAIKNHLHMTEIDGKSTYFRVLVRNKKVVK